MTPRARRLRVLRTPVTSNRAPTAGQGTAAPVFHVEFLAAAENDEIAQTVRAVARIASGQPISVVLRSAS